MRVRWAGVREIGIRLFGLAMVCVLTDAAAAQACAPAGSKLRFGLYAHFEPVSHSADPDPATPAFNAGPRYDLVGGGITILESRTGDAAGRSAIVFIAGHIEFRQSLLVRASDAQRLARHRDLTDADRVGVLAGTTGEARLLELAIATKGEYVECH